MPFAMTQEPMERFNDSIDLADNGCWNWNKSLVNEYGKLEQVTPAENTMRSNAESALNARKTHCPRGHQYTSVQYIGRNTWRVCRPCKKINRKILEERKRNVTT